MKKFNYSDYVDLKPISKATLESVRKNTAKYIYVLNKQDGTIKCEKCGCTTTLLGTKHKSIINCPVCHSKMEVCHIWRRSYTENIGWEVVAENIDENTLLMRYILSFSINGKVSVLGECAREVLDFANLKNYYLEHTTKGWRKYRSRYFKELHMGYQENRFCCRGANVHNKKQFFREVQKLKVFKYMNVSEVYSDKRLYPSSVIGWLGRRADLYEKLQKVGLSNIVKKDLFTYYREEIEYNSAETKLHKMLGITKGQLAILRKYPAFDVLKALQNTAISDENSFSLMFKYNMSYSDMASLGSIDMFKPKVINYIKKNGIDVADYTHYIDVIKKLEYPLDKAYLYPKDFDKMDKIVADEWAEKKDTLQDGLIKKLSDGLHKLPQLQELLNGSKGFLVYVPESQADLDKESKALHNCIRGYGDRLMEQKTILFFIRRLNAPDTPFVAMEYSHGQVVQVRYDHNEDVRTSKKQGSAEIIDLANAIADVLRSNKVLVA